MKSGMIFMGMGFELLGLVLAALYLGNIIDKHAGTKGLAVAGLVVLMLIGWFVHLILLLKKFMKDEPRESKPKN